MKVRMSEDFRAAYKRISVNILVIRCVIHYMLM